MHLLIFDVWRYERALIFLFEITLITHLIILIFNEYTIPIDALTWNAGLFSRNVYFDAYCTQRRNEGEERRTDWLKTEVSRVCWPRIPQTHWTPTALDGFIRGACIARRWSRLTSSAKIRDCTIRGRAIRSWVPYEPNTKALSPAI